MILFLLIAQLQINISGETADIAKIVYDYNATPPTIYVYFDEIFKGGFEL